MNSSIQQSTIPSTSTTTESEISTMVPFNRGTFLATCNRHQEWSLPDSIIYYISKNPSTAKVYGKLIQSCKYFMIRNHPIIVKNLVLEQRGDYLEFSLDEKTVDLNTVPSKIWLTNKINVFTWYLPFLQNSLSAVIPKLSQSNIKELTLRRQTCSINDLKFLGSKCESIHFYETVVMNENGAIVAVEDVFQIFPNAKNFQFGNQRSMMITQKTFQELVKIPHFLNLQYLRLYAIPENFDIDCFYAYMKNNKKTKIYLKFRDGISYGYRNRLQAIVNETLAYESRDYKPPYIRFPGLDESVYDRM